MERMEEFLLPFTHTHQSILEAAGHIIPTPANQLLLGMGQII
jgi:hypothetical protein